MTEFKSCVQIKILQPRLPRHSLTSAPASTLQSPYGQRLIDADLVQRGQVLGFLQSRQTLLFLPLLLAGVELVEAVAYDWNGQGDH